MNQKCSCGDAYEGGKKDEGNNKTEYDLAEFSEKLKELGGEIEINEGALMSNFTSFRIGGKADFLVTVRDSESAAEIIRLCKSCNIPYMFMGNGTNLLICDEGIRGVVIRFYDPEAEFIKVEKIDESQAVITCGAGITLKQLCRAARDNSLSGLEFAYGIPGTVGGGIYMNAGAYGGQMADCVYSAKAILPSGQLTEIKLEDMALGYRSSVFMTQKALVTEVSFLLKYDDKEEIGARMREFMRRRREKQPLEYPSGGSFFKRPEGYFAGALIEQSDLKGFGIGGAQVSEKHAGFVINTGCATCEDVCRLCRHIKKTVYEKHGVRLEREVLLIGREED